MAALYPLRDLSTPIGVSAYHLTAALHEEIAQHLLLEFEAHGAPTAAARPKPRSTRGTLGPRARGLDFRGDVG